MSSKATTTIARTRRTRRTTRTRTKTKMRTRTTMEGGEEDAREGWVCCETYGVLTSFEIDRGMM